MVRSSLTRFGLALAATLLVGVAALAIRGQLTAIGGSPSSRPTTSPSGPYELRLVEADGTTRTIRIDPGGAGCEPLRASDFLYRTCVLATNRDPAVIGGEAFGHLNAERTPSHEALIWRGVVDHDPTVCGRGGLLDDALRSCEAAVGKGSRRVEDLGIRVSVGP